MTVYNTQSGLQFDGQNQYLTPALPVVYGGVASGTNLILRSNSSNQGKGSVLLDEGTPSVDAQSGNLVVVGGVGIQGALFVNQRVSNFAQPMIGGVNGWFGSGNGTGNLGGGTGNQATVAATVTQIPTVTTIGGTAVGTTYRVYVPTRPYVTGITVAVNNTTAAGTAAAYNATAAALTAVDLDLTTIDTTAGSASGTTYTLSINNMPTGWNPQGSTITVSGITPSAYNGTFTITSTTVNSITYTGGTSNPGSVTVQGTVKVTSPGVSTITYTGGTSNPGSITINGQVMGTGYVSGLQITNPGTGYSAAPTVNFIGGQGLLGGSSASATALISNGQIVGFTSLSGGSGYIEPPMVVLTGGTGGSFLLGANTYNSNFPGGYTEIARNYSPTVSRFLLTYPQTAFALNANLNATDVDLLGNYYGQGQGATYGYSGLTIPAGTLVPKIIGNQPHPALPTLNIYQYDQGIRLRANIYYALGNPAGNILPKIWLGNQILTSATFSGANSTNYVLNIDLTIKAQLVNQNANTPFAVVTTGTMNLVVANSVTGTVQDYHVYSVTNNYSQTMPLILRLTNQIVTNAANATITVGHISVELL